MQGLCDAYERYLNTKKLPGKDELPPLFVEEAPKSPSQPAADKAAGQAPSTSEQVAAPTGREGSGDVAQAQARTSFIQRVAGLPKAVRITALAFAALLIVIAVSEATLPGRIQALPLNEAALMCVNDDEGIQVCLRDNKLYVFADRARTDASGLLFAVRAQDSHGYVTRETFDIASRASGRYSTSDAYVLEVNLARYVGYTELQYGEVDAAAPMAGDEFEWAWSETYARGEQVTLKRG